MSIFTDLTDADLAEAIGTRHAMIKKLQKELDAAKEDLKSRGVRSVSNNNYDVSLTDKVRTILDQESVKQFLGENRLQRFMKDTPFTQVDVKAKAAASKAAAA
jgi:hypothetical protein